MILHLLQVYLRIQVSSHPILINYFRGRHHWTSRDWLYWGWLLWRLNGYIRTNWGIIVCKTLSLSCRTLCCKTLNCKTLTSYCIHKLILSSRISGIRCIGTIHLFSNLLHNQIYLKFLSYLIFVLIPYIYIYIYIYIHSSLLLRFIWQTLLKQAK